MSTDYRPGDVVRDCHGATWMYVPDHDGDRWATSRAGEPDDYEEWFTTDELRGHGPLTLLVRDGELILPELTSQDFSDAHAAYLDAAADPSAPGALRAALDAYRARLTAAVRPDTGGDQ